MRKSERQRERVRESAREKRELCVSEIEGERHVSVSVKVRVSESRDCCTWEMPLVDFINLLINIEVLVEELVDRFFLSS